MKSPAFVTLVKAMRKSQKRYYAKPPHVRLPEDLRDMLKLEKQVDAACKNAH